MPHSSISFVYLTYLLHLLSLSFLPEEREEKVEGEQWNVAEKEGGHS